MATSDNSSLLSKVVNFVSGPVARKPGLESAPLAAEVPSKASMQAVIERKAHNDAVRKREFELLRQMRRREPRTHTIDLTDRASLFPSSMMTRPGERALTIKKIDEIEQQMSQQWWKAKPGKVLPTPVPPTEASFDRLRTPAQVDDDTVQGRLEASLYDEPQLPGLSDFPPTRVDPFPHDPEVEDAAILFANGDFEGASKMLQGMVCDGEQQGDGEQTWWTLLDLYRVIGDRARFDAAALAFAARFGRSAPQWGVAADVAPDRTDAAAPRGQGSDWSAPEVLGPQALQKLKDVLAQGAAPWCLDWSALTRVQDEVVSDMADLFSAWCTSPMRLRFTGARRLDRVLRKATPSGDADVARTWWLWRLEALRLVRREDDFERVALDYCITYEMSPPAWAPPLCDCVSSDDASDGACDGPESLLLGDDLLSMFEGEFGTTQPGPSGFQSGGLVAEPQAAGAQFVTVKLSGELQGDVAPSLAKLDRCRAGFSKLVVDCRHLVRVDFAAAGHLLNWTSARSADGCKLEFKNVNRLVATFFSVIGIDEFARIIPTPH
jgi:ABC-type transporter Mla MlaB component